MRREAAHFFFLFFSYRWMGLESQTREKGRRQAKKGDSRGAGPCGGGGPVSHTQETDYATAVETVHTHTHVSSAFDKYEPEQQDDIVAALLRRRRYPSCCFVHHLSRPSSRQSGQLQGSRTLLYGPRRQLRRPENAAKRHHRRPA